MRSLEEKFKNVNIEGNNLEIFAPEDLMDTILSLCIAIDESKFVQASCENIAVDDGKVFLLEKNIENAYFMAPEVLFGRHIADKKSAWFSLGLFMYYIIFGRTFYYDNEISLVYLDDQFSKSDSLIQNLDLPEFLNEPMRRLTSWNREEREKGVKPLLEAIKKYECIIEIKYMYHDNLVDSQKIRLNKPSIKFVSYTPIYPNSLYQIEKDIEFDYRPGIHTYKVSVIQRK